MTRELAIPTPEQLRWQNMELGMFIHWAPNVYQESQSDLLTTPLDRINPMLLDTVQWVQTAKDLGAKYIILVAKHCGGFCLWQTDTTTYGIKNTPYRNGKGDIVRELSEECKKQGMKLGIYLSPADRFLGAGTRGVCLSPEAQSRYDEIYRRQLREILTRYGEIIELWFDGSTACGIGDIIEEYAPGAIVFQSRQANIRWVGNEMGIAKYPAWNSVPRQVAITGTATVLDGSPYGDVWMPLECDTTLRRDWFWSETNQESLKSVDNLMSIYYHSVGSGAVLLLNANPDRTGCIPAQDAARVREFGDIIRQLYQGRIMAACGQGAALELDFGSRKKIDHVMIMEDIANGERVRQYCVEGFDGAQWRTLATGTAVGHKRIERFPAIDVEKVRFIALKYAAVPIIRDFSAYDSGLHLPQDDVCYPCDDFFMVHQWGPETFYGNDSLKQEMTIDLSGIFTDVQDIGQYLVQLQDISGEVEITGVQLELDAMAQPDYIRLMSKSSLQMYLPGASGRLVLRLSVRLPGLASEGVVKIKRL